MSSNRLEIFSPGEIYHTFNRGVEKRRVFLDKKDYTYALRILKYYLFKTLPLSFSKYSDLSFNQKINYESSYFRLENQQVDILSYCLMPNHFHLLIKELLENGISKFMANFSNSYTKYFNLKETRVGPLFQGTFKSVYVESDNQLINVSRYIHLNPIKSMLVKLEDLNLYQWSSFPEFLNRNEQKICNTDLIMSYFGSKEKFIEFTYDQRDFHNKLESIEYLRLD